MADRKTDVEKLIERFTDDGTASKIMAELKSHGWAFVPINPSPLRLFRGAEQTSIFDTYTVMTMPVAALEGMAGNIKALNKSVRIAIIKARAD